MSRLTLRRILLVVIALPLIGLVIHAWDRQRRADAARKYWDEAYEVIGKRDYRYEFEVLKLMGSDGEIVSPFDWPESFGEIPEYWEKLKEFEAEKEAGRLGKFTFLPGPSTKIWWRMWRVTGRHKWIAVGFAYDGSGGRYPTVVLKRSGLDEPFPED